MFVQLKQCMDFSEVVQRRRSYRKFNQEQPVPDELIVKAFEDALLAPNSSNVQTWDFFWVNPQSASRSKLVTACLSQSAARQASHLIVVTANPALWKRAHLPLIDWVVQAKAHPSVLIYYKKLIPFLYGYTFLAPLKAMATLIAGVFRPVPRGPFSKRDLQEVAIKSAALAAQNFVLSITNQGAATCMMEGFDEKRVKSLLDLPRQSRVVMVIAVGYADPQGLWGQQMRLPFEKVVHKV